MSYSQNGEDAWVIQNLINKRRLDIIAIEVGAFDPYQYSNSFALEKYLGSTCFLIEPTLFRAARIAKKRPKSHVFQAVADKNWGLSTILGDSAVSGNPQVLSPGYVTAWNLSGAKEKTVTAFPISALQTSPEVPHIDFLSIDVQGSELEVLKGLDFERPIGAICVELEGYSLERDAECRDLLASRNFLCRVVLGTNEIWVDPTYHRWPLLWTADNVTLKRNLVFPFLEPSMMTDALASLK